VFFFFFFFFWVSRFFVFSFFLKPFYFFVPGSPVFFSIAKPGGARPFSPSCAFPLSFVFFFFFLGFPSFTTYRGR